MKDKFYQNFYTQIAKNVNQKGILGWFYYRFKKFETHRLTMSLSLLKNCYFRSILDIGCANGDLLKKIKKTQPTAEIFGTDVCEEAIIFCKKCFPEVANNFSVQNIDQGLNFNNNSFDAVVMIATLEHVLDPLFAFKEIKRILKPGGILILEVPNIAFIKYRLDLLFGIRPRTSWGYGWDGGHLNYFTRKDLRKALLNEKIKPLIITGSGIFLSLRKWWGNLLLPNIIIYAKSI